MKKIVSAILVLGLLVTLFIFSGCQLLDGTKKNPLQPHYVESTIDYSQYSIDEQVELRTEKRYKTEINFLWKKDGGYYTKYTFIPTNGIGGVEEFDVWAYTNASGELVLQDNYQSVLLLEDYEKFLGNNLKNVLKAEDIKVFVEFNNEYVPGDTRWEGYTYWPINYPTDATIEKTIDDKVDLDAEVYVVCKSGIVTDDEEDVLKEEAIKLLEHFNIRGSFQCLFLPEEIYNKVTRDNAFYSYHEYVCDENKKTQGFRFDIKQPPLQPNEPIVTTTKPMPETTSQSMPETTIVSTTN